MEAQNYIKGGKPNFPQIEEVGKRPWGKEELLVLVPGKYMLKRLTMNKGAKGGLQFHRLKDECGMLLSGKMLIKHDDGSGEIVERIVNSGEVFHFPPGVVHQEEALEECVIIEGSTPHFNDRVRMEGHFGLDDVSGMPTTSLEQIEEK